MNYRYIIDNCKPFVIENDIAREVDYDANGVFYVVENGEEIKDIKGYETFNLYEIERKFNVEENALYKQEIEEIEEQEEKEEVSSKTKNNKKNK